MVRIGTILPRVCIRGSPCKDRGSSGSISIVEWANGKNPTIIEERNFSLYLDLWSTAWGLWGDYEFS